MRKEKEKQKDKYSFKRTDFLITLQFINDYCFDSEEYV